jgi:hypothetical protein
MPAFIQIWWTATALAVFAVNQRYYFFGKWNANLLRERSEAEHQELAEYNKR